MANMAQAAMAAARERQLDWLLDEVLGGARAATAARVRQRARGSRWLAAALALAAAGAAFGVGWLQHERAGAPIVEPVYDDEQRQGPDGAQPGDVVFTECRDPAELATLPDGTRNLRCFGFDDVGLARVTRFVQLERLDLGSIAYDENGTGLAPRVSDEGLRLLAKLDRLQWLSLAHCREIDGSGFDALAALPRLEHLDLSFTGVRGRAFELLPRLPSLRSLTLANCQRFHGGALADVARIPGLRRLVLANCSHVAAADALHLTKLRELRHLDLRGCSGGKKSPQEIAFDDFSITETAEVDEQPAPGEPAPPKPTQDGIGITDAVLAELAALPLEQLLLGGCLELTDASGPALAKMRSLRTLDLSRLPNITGEFFAQLPAGLEELSLEENPQLPAASLRALKDLSDLHTLRLFDAAPVDAQLLGEVLTGKHMRVLGLGAHPPRAGIVFDRAVADVVARHPTLVELDLRCMPLTEQAARRLATLPALRVLDLSGPVQLPRIVRGQTIAALAANRSIEVLRLSLCGFEPADLRALQDLPLVELDLRDATIDAGSVRELAPHWPGCRILMPDYQVMHVPK